MQASDFKIQQPCHDAKKKIAQVDRSRGMRNLRSVHPMDGAKHRNEDNYQHHDDVNAQAPKHGAHSSRKFLRSETHVLFRRDDLVRFKKRQHHARIFEVWLPRIHSDWLNAGPANSSEF
jgi:hypothetical protein